MIIKNVCVAAEKERDVLYEVLFDEEFVGGLTVRYVPLVC